MPRTAATEDSAERTVSPKQLVALIREASNKKSKIATLAGELGERVKNACENAHLHRGAYALSVESALAKAMTAASSLWTSRGDRRRAAWMSPNLLSS